jgi:hypothetical protein
MLYFNEFPKVLGSDYNSNGIVMTNIMARAEIIPSLLKNPLLFYSYDIKESDRPDTIAHKYYGDSNRYWMVLYANQIFDPQWEWPLTSNEFSNYIIKKYSNDAANAYNISANTSVVPSAWYSTGSEAPTWSTFLNNYGIWTGAANSVTTNTYQTNVSFPVNGNYQFNLSVDNYGILYLDGNSILSTANGDGFQTVNTTSVYVTAGPHTVTVTGTNYGGPAGIATQIINPNSTELWNTLSATANTYVTTGSNITDSQVLSYTQSTVYQYIKTITTTDSVSNETTSKTIVIDQNTFNNTLQGTTVNTFADGSSVTQVVTVTPVSIYDYELQQNEAKRNINLINRTYADQFERDFSTIMRK